MILVSHYGCIFQLEIDTGGTMESVHVHDCALDGCHKVKHSTVRYFAYCSSSLPCQLWHDESNILPNIITSKNLWFEYTIPTLEKCFCNVTELFILWDVPYHTFHNNHECNSSCSCGWIKSAARYYISDIHALRRYYINFL